MLSSIAAVGIDHRNDDFPPITSFDPDQVLSGTVSPEPPLPSPIEFGNYDVLLTPIDHEDGPLRFAQSNHVGNQRFRVILSIYRQRYLLACERGNQDECARIAAEVMNTICSKCSPNGRFYEPGHDDQWRELASSTVIFVIESALRSEPKNCLERSPKRICRRSAACGSVVSIDSEEECIISPGSFDVICEHGGLRLKQDISITGNNRLQVLLDIRMKTYNKTNARGKRTVVQEIVRSIVDDARSQFLQEGETPGMYTIMTRDDANACIKSAFEAKIRGVKCQDRRSEVQKLLERKKKRQVLGKLERRKRYACKLPESSLLATTFVAFQEAHDFELQAEI